MPSCHSYSGPIEKLIQTIPDHPGITLKVLSGKRIQDHFTPYILWEKYSLGYLTDKITIILIFPTINFFKNCTYGCCED